jgi:transposase InsO family protein
LINDAVDDGARHAYVRSVTSRPVCWPGESEPRPVSRSSLMRWRDQFRQSGLPGLAPCRRGDRGQGRIDRSTIVCYALGLLYEQPDRSLTQLLIYLKLEFPDASLTRSTLHRELTRHSAYEGIRLRRSGRKRKLRDRYEVDHPHHIWQLDGKGPFMVRMADGRRRKVCVLSIQDAFSRCILAACIAPSESLASAVVVTRRAIARWGVAERFQMDRGSAFDSHAFREGLAQLGVHRNRVKAKNPEAQGRIEAYHRSLGRWFVKELRCQEVQSLTHLEQLLDAMIEQLYNQHHHTALKGSPAETLAGRRSERRVGAEDLARAFWAQHTKTPHRKTGEVTLPNGTTYRVTLRYAGKSCVFRYDPVEGSERAELTRDGAPPLALEPYQRKRVALPPTNERGVGQLQKLLDQHRGATRPNAQPGFGLPEVFRELERLLDHRVPADEQEAEAIRRFYAELGPLPAVPFRRAVDLTLKALGSDRPLASYLDHLARQIRRDQQQQQQPKENNDE